MMEQMPSSQDRFVKSLGKKFEKEAHQTKEALTDRIVERIGDISKAKKRLTDDYARANGFSEKMNMTTEMWTLQAEEQKLKDIYERVIKPSREELMFGDEPLTAEEEKLIEKETPFLLVGGKKPLRDTKEADIEMELEPGKDEMHELGSDETVMTAQESGLHNIEPLSDVPLYRSEEPSLPNIKRPRSFEAEPAPVLLTKTKEKTPSKPRLTPELSSENILIESIDREAAALPEKDRLSFYKYQRDKILDNLSIALTKSADMPDEENEALVNRLEARFHTLQARVNSYKKIHESKTREVPNPEQQERTDIDLAA